MTLVHEGAELLPGSRLISNATLEQSALKEHPPGLLDADLGELTDELSNSLYISELLLDLDCLDEQVLVKARKLETLDQNFS